MPTRRSFRAFSTSNPKFGKNFIDGNPRRGISNTPVAKDKVGFILGNELRVGQRAPLHWCKSREHRQHFFFLFF